MLALMAQIEMVSPAETGTHHAVPLAFVFDVLASKAVLAKALVQPNVCRLRTLACSPACQRPIGQVQAPFV